MKVKKIFNLILSSVLLISLCSFVLSFGIGNERTINWLISSFSKDLGYRTEVTFDSIDWRLYKSNIKLERIKASSLEVNKVNSFLAEEIDFNINLLDLISLKPFLKVGIKRGVLDLIESDNSKEIIANKKVGFIFKNTNFQIKEVIVTGTLSELDIQDYFFLFSSSTDKQTFPNFLVNDLIVSDLRLGPLSLYEVNINMHPIKNGLRFNLLNSDLSGFINVSLPISKGLQVELETLNLLTSFIDSDVDIFSYLFDSLHFPILFSTQSLNLSERDLGSWKFLIYKRRNTLFFDQIQGAYKNIFIGENGLTKKVKSFKNLENKSVDIELKRHFNISSDESKEILPSVLSISRKETKITTNFKGKISTENLNKSLEILNEDSIESNFIAKETYIIPNISWEGMPNEFNFEVIEGTLAFRIDDLLIKELGEDVSKATGLLKLISLFNVTHTFEGLTNLNFRRNFSSGFQADRVEGFLGIDFKKINTIQPIIFNTGSGKFSWSGHVGKTNGGEFNELDFEVIMTLPIKEYLPAYALILGGPITAGLVYIAGKAFEKPLNKLSSGKWRISGDIDNLKTEFVEWFED